MFINSIFGERWKSLEHASTFRGFSSEEIKKELEGDYQPKKLLIVTVEGSEFPRDVEKVNSESGVWARGDSKVLYNVLVIRDPFNLEASRIKGGSEPFPIEQHIAHLKEYLRLTGNLQVNAVSISFNAWVLSEEYRRKLGQALSLEGEYWHPYQRIPAEGSGSSFSGFIYQGRASDMSVLDRWQNYKNHPRLKALAANEELMDLVKQVFGYQQAMEVIAKE